MQPALDAVIAPLDACVSADRPARYASASFDACCEAWIRALDEGAAEYVPGVQVGRRERRTSNVLCTRLRALRRPAR